jgi:hypothetical protein
MSIDLTAEIVFGAVVVIFALLLLANAAVTTANLFRKHGLAVKIAAAAFRYAWVFVLGAGGDRKNGQRRMR